MINSCRSLWRTLRLFSVELGKFILNVFLKKYRVKVNDQIRSCGHWASTDHRVVLHLHPLQSCNSENWTKHLQKHVFKRHKHQQAIIHTKGWCAVESSYIFPSINAFQPVNKDNCSTHPHTYILREATKHAW